MTGPVYGRNEVAATDHNLTRQHPGEPLGKGIIVKGQVLDDGGRPVPHTLVEIWQANAAGRYFHQKDDHPAPRDPNFTGAGRALTDANGFYEFVTIKPGSQSLGQSRKCVASGAHSCFSFRAAFATRLVTQMYFPGDPPFACDPISQSIPDERARQRLISRFDLEITQPAWALGFRFDIVLRGSEATPFEG